MISADSLPDDDLDYPVSLRQARRAPHEGTAPQGRFEATSRQRLARRARYRRGSAGQARSGIHHRGRTPALESRL